MSRRYRSNPRRRKGAWKGTLVKIGLWYGGFCVANLAADSYLGSQGGPEAGGVTGVLASINGALMPLNVLNLIAGAGSSGTAALPAYDAQILGINPDGSTIYG